MVFYGFPTQKKNDETPMATQYLRPNKFRPERLLAAPLDQQQIAREAREAPRGPELTPHAVHHFASRAKGRPEKNMVVKNDFCSNGLTIYIYIGKTWNI